MKIIGGERLWHFAAYFAKLINAGNAILELEGVYITGYTNILNDTVRSVVVPATSSNIKKRDFDEPGGTTYVMRRSHSWVEPFCSQVGSTPTELFGLTTSNQTMLAAASNGDNTNVASGGMGIMGQNRTMFGTPPELMARWGYRWLGVSLGYDTTKFDLVPAWKSGDTTEKNIGNPLNVCQVGSTTVPCRWSTCIRSTWNQRPCAERRCRRAEHHSPLMDGTATPRTSTNFARESHVHPTDTSLVPKTATVNGHALSGNVTVTNVRCERGAPCRGHSHLAPPVRSPATVLIRTCSLPPSAGTFAVEGRGLLAAGRTDSRGCVVSVSVEARQFDILGAVDHERRERNQYRPRGSRRNLYPVLYIVARPSMVLPLQQGGATPVSGTANSNRSEFGEQ